MSGLSLQNLKDYKDEILKAEIGALLFNLGKTHIGFWIGKDSNQCFNEESVKSKLGYFFMGYRDYHGYKDKNTKEKIYPLEIDLSKFRDLKDFILGQDKKVKFLFEIKETNNNSVKEISWQEFFKGDSSEEEFIKKIFFRGCENINSGIDKGNPVVCFWKFQT